ncbi:MAG: corrinoid protein [Spirochaetaceae bacterium]|jgi:methylmalonyl-CoA mutase cobalamin-binding domain/chain|nr:corrinoid protein [Spirochaetaceae bacterium]
MSKIDEIGLAVETGKAKNIEALVTEALAEGIPALEILNNGLEAAMARIGDKFQKNEVFVPELLVAARAMKKAVAVLKPSLAGLDNVSLGKCIIGTVQGDLHDIGKNLVALMLEGAGFEVIDLGVDVAPEQYVAAIKEHPDVRIVGLSGLLTTTLSNMKLTIEAIKASGLSGFKIIVGGAPVTQLFAEQIGADGYSEDAGGAAVLAKKLAS